MLTFHCRPVLFADNITETYSKPCQTLFMVEPFANIAIFANSFILDV